MLASVGRRVGYSVRKMRSGRWQLLVRDPSSGEQLGLGTYADKIEAERAGQRHASSMSAGTWLDPRRGEVAVEDYVTGWLAGKRRTGAHGDRYAEEAGRLARMHVLPYLGRRNLVDLSPAIIRRWHADLTSARMQASPSGKAGLVPAKAYRLLHAALEDAVRDELISRNPCVERSAGVERSPERKLVEPEQIAAIADEIRPWWRATVLLAAWCALRFGELAQLRRRDIDLLHESISVTKAKTAAGVRTVAIPRPLMKMLEAHLEQWSQPGADGLVFVGPNGGPMVRSNFSTDFRRAADAVGLPGTTFHDLRHAGGTMAAQAGATERELQARLGHASPNAARRYQHAAQRRDRDLADRLGAMLGEVAVTSANAHTTRTVRNLRPDS